MKGDPDTRSDEALMQAYAGGEARAFDELFRRHGRALFTFFLHQSSSAALAEDLFQEVFLRVIRHRRRYRATGRFRAWLFSIAHNVMTDTHRTSARRKATEPLDATEREHGADPALDAHDRDLGERIQAALERLPAEQREVFLLRERSGLGYDAIADATGTPLATVKSRMRYAMAALRRLLTPEHDALTEPLHD